MQGCVETWVLWVCSGFRLQGAFHHKACAYVHPFDAPARVCVARVALHCVAMHHAAQVYTVEHLVSVWLHEAIRVYADAAADAKDAFSVEKVAPWGIR